MISNKRCIVKKIPVRSTTIQMEQNDVLISSSNGAVKSIVRGAGKRSLVRDENIEWYLVDGREYQYDISYSGGDINFTFSFCANAAFPTLLIHNKELVGKDMPTVVLNWASKASVANTVADFLSDAGIRTEKQMFEGNICKELEAALLAAYQEHFIKNWGMFLNSVSIKRKISASSQTKNNTGFYDYIL